MKIDTLQTVELAEGVEIRLPMAGPAARSLAWLIDILIIAGSILILILFTTLLGVFADSGIATGIYMIGSFFIYWFYFVFFENGKHGATPGKRTLGLRVVQTSGTPITFTQAIIRNFIRAIDSLPFYLIGLTACTSTRRFQRLGDLAANTVVIYTKSEHRPSLPPHEDLKALPPPVPLTREEQLAIVTFTERAALWSDERKIELANHLAPLTGATGPAAVDRLFSIGRWLQKSS
ncbi:MAG: RDD family protein [Verrucomicrobiota bacterium]